MKKVLYFTATWCSPCKRLRPIVEQLEKDMLGVIPFDIIDADDNINLVRKYSVMSVPTLILLQDEVEINRISGMQTREQLEGFVGNEKNIQEDVQS